MLDPTSMIGLVAGCRKPPPLPAPAVDLKRNMNDLIAEALDDLFTKHGERPPSR
jgi:hypothetical protein